MTDAQRAPVPLLDWNVLVTSRERAQRRLRQTFRPLIRLRNSGFRNVLIGRAGAVEDFLTAVWEHGERRPSMRRWLGRILPIERTFLVDPAGFEAQIQAETDPLVDRLSGHSYHVRVERRGHKGLINTRTSERALGEHIFAVLESRGQPPAVVFHEPDVVIVIEVVGDVAGVGLVTRRLREQCPFVRVD
ncbi:MAG: domain RNA-binding protein [Deltaproteobacteria bacterium]|jgi:tRNA(Ser,Leu) C12 N-acetylase TAN1|nr:domain RNA-binding protein [Deltaproteobacteria bacterium]